MSFYVSKGFGKTLDGLDNVQGFDSAIQGAYLLEKQGSLYIPKKSATAIINPNGGLEDGPSGLGVKAGDGILVDSNGVNVINRVKTTGDTMTGDLNMGGNRITSVFGPPSAPDDVCTKAYADSKLSKSGGTMLGNINMNGYRIINLEPAVEPDDAVNVVSMFNEGDYLTGLLPNQPSFNVSVFFGKQIIISAFSAYFQSIKEVKEFAGGLWTLPDSAFTTSKINTLIYKDDGNFDLLENLIPDPVNQTVVRLAFLTTDPPDVVNVFKITPYICSTPWKERISTLMSGMSLTMTDYVNNICERGDGSQESESINYPTEPTNFKTFGVQQPASLLHWRNNIIQSATTNLLPFGPERYSGAGVLESFIPSNWTIMYHFVGNQSNSNFITYTPIDVPTIIDPYDYIDWENYTSNDPGITQGNTLRTIITVQGNYGGEPTRIGFFPVGITQSTNASMNVDPDGGLVVNPSGIAVNPSDGISVSATGVEVIDRVKNVGDTMTGNLNMSSNIVTGLPTTYPILGYTGIEALSYSQIIALLGDLQAILIQKAGDTVSGNLTFTGGATINGIPAPTSSTDVVNKSYVDAIFKTTPVATFSATPNTRYKILDNIMPDKKIFSVQIWVERRAGEWFTTDCPEFADAWPRFHIYYVTNQDSKLSVWYPSVPVDWTRNYYIQYIETA